MAQPRAPMEETTSRGLLILAALGLEVRALRSALPGAVPVTRIPRLGDAPCTGWLGWREARDGGDGEPGDRQRAGARRGWTPPSGRPGGVPTPADRGLRGAGGSAGWSRWWGAPSGRSPVVVLQTGMSGAGLGPGGIVGAVRALRPAVVLAVGFGGGLDPRLRVGDLVLADPVVDPTVPDHWWPAVDLASAAVAAARRARLVLHVGPVLSVSKVEATAAGKAAVAGRRAALALDMESACFARAAAEAAVPFLALRVISDAAGDRLPDEPWRLVTADGRAPLGRTLCYLGRRPGALPTLVRTGLRARRASTALAAFLGAWLDGGER